MFSDDQKRFQRWAALGLSPVHGNSWPVWPPQTQAGRQALETAYASGRWAISGPNTGAPSLELLFAGEFARYLGVRHCVPTANGSSALVIALEALGVGRGDEVIVPALTWIADCTVVLRVGARPVLVDVLSDTLCLDPEAVEAAVTSRTRAVIAVHLYGAVAELGKIRAVCQRHGLALIEDCAQAHGACHRGRLVGGWGDIGVFSFQQSKLLTSGEGGAAVTNDPCLHRRLEALRADGRRFKYDCAFGEMQLEPAREIHGSNYCMSEFHAALLRVGLPALDSQNAIRRLAAERLAEKWSERSDLRLLVSEGENNRRVYYGAVIRYEGSSFSGVTSTQMCVLLRFFLGLSNADIHPPPMPMSRSELFMPWTNRSYSFDAGDEESWRSMRFDVTQSAVDSSIVFHHRVLLAPTREFVTALDDAFARVYDALRIRGVEELFRLGN